MKYLLKHMSREVQLFIIQKGEVGTHLTSAQHAAVLGALLWDGLCLRHRFFIYTLIVHQRQRL